MGVHFVKEDVLWMGFVKKLGIDESFFSYRLPATVILA